MKTPAPARRETGFTLVELLVSMVLLVGILALLVSMTDSTRRTWASANTKVEQFKGAREAFETITRRLSDATLNTYWDYDDQTKPTKYIRQSELRFISGPFNKVNSDANANSDARPTHAVFFQAPLGFVSKTSDFGKLSQLLNTWGYFVELGSDKDGLRPPFLDAMSRPPAPRTRFRLMELMEPSERLSIYTQTSGFQPGTTTPKCLSYTGADWFTTPLNATSPRLARPVAENIVAIVILPKLAPNDQAAGNYKDYSLAPQYLYDSTGTNAAPVLNPKNQLPPIVQLTMVAVDEASFTRFHPDNSSAAVPDLYYNKQLFTDAADYQKDVQKFSDELTKLKLSYRTFTTNVSIKSAKWSTN